MNYMTKVISNILTKSKIISGLQCHKKLWFDINDPLKLDSSSFLKGNRFGDYAKQHYGSGLDLTDIHDSKLAIALTEDALINDDVEVIYEAAFSFNDVLIRADVLVRNQDKWNLIEVKSSTFVKDTHIKDAQIQAYVIESCQTKLASIKIGYINKEFTYQGGNDYDGLLKEFDITRSNKFTKADVIQWIQELKPIAVSNETPQVVIGDHCKDPYECQYRGRCESNIANQDLVPISIIPFVGKKLEKEWNNQGVYDLRKIPSSALKNIKHKIIQQAHLNDRVWVSPDIQNEINSMAWPRYFVDFEGVHQGVPKIEQTKPYDVLPFQWSVHQWNNVNEVVKLEDGSGYLEFVSPEMDREFLSSLCDALGEKGPIFAHNANYERSVLQSLSERPRCREFQRQVDNILSRIVDTKEIAKKGFYAPQMNGSYSLKQIVKAIPDASHFYSEGELAGGDDAMVAWFKCTDPKTTVEEKNKWKRMLKRYCAQDTIALYHFLKYLIHFKTTPNLNSKLISDGSMQLKFEEVA
jgi:predicted RecB family nuclease